MKHRTSGRRWTAALTGVGLGLASAWSADAQSVRPTTGQVAGTAQQLNPAGDTERERRPRAADVFSGAPPADCSPALRADAHTFVLQDVQVDGSSALSRRDVLEAFGEMKGKSVPVGAVCEIADRISTTLFRRGVLARVYLPAQRIVAGEGTVRIRVIEAKIVSVRFQMQGDVGPVERRVEVYLNKLRGLAPFDLDTAQRYLLLANDLPGVIVTASLRHSMSATGSAEDTAGAVDLDVTVSRRAEDVVAAVQNTSSSELGPWSGIVRVDLNSFTSLGERTTLIGYSTIGSFEQEVIQLVEQARIGGSGLYAGASFAYGRSQPGGALGPLHLRGDSYVGTIEADYPLVRRRRTNLTLGGGMDFVSQQTAFPGGGVLSDDSLRVLWARADASVVRTLVQSEAGDLSASTGLSIQGRKGLEALGASGASQPGLSRLQGRADAWIVRADGQAAIRFEPAGRGLPITLGTRVQGQWADRPLLAYEELAIGNLTIGRGYDPAALSGDRVIAADFRGQLGPLSIGRLASLSPYGFFDVARVSNLDAGSVDRTVRSVGGGVEFRLPFGLRGDLAYAKPLDKTFAAATSKPPSRVLFQLIFAR